MKKNLFTFAITCVIASILFSSCSITKRHYTNGYYVSHSSGKQTTASKAQEPIVQKKTNPSLYSIQNLPQENSVSSEAVQPAVQEKGTITASNKQVVSKTNATRVANTHAKHPMYQSAIAPVKKRSSSFANKKVSADSLAGDALSLFWIIILILLILWLVAILTGGWGLGGFVYLLLVIALILLILWLLRII